MLIFDNLYDDFESRTELRKFTMKAKGLEVLLIFNAANEIPSRSCVSTNRSYKKITKMANKTKKTLVNFHDNEIGSCRCCCCWWWWFFFEEDDEEEEEEKCESECLDLMRIS